MFVNLPWAIQGVTKDMVGEKAINYNYTYVITRFGIWQNLRFICLKIDTSVLKVF